MRRILTTWAWLVLGAGSLLTGQSPSVEIPRFPAVSGIPGIDPLESASGAPSSKPPVIGAADPARIERRASIVSVEKIWDQSPHNAFTDLIRFNGRWYCAFREGAAHVSPAGAVRVISSADGVEWSSSFRIASDYADIRDPKLSITPDNRLMLSAMAAYNPPTEIDYQTLAWYTLDGRDWGEPFKIGDPDLWLWRISWHRGNAYSLAYSTREERFLQMYVGLGGMRFQTVGGHLLPESKPTEATLLFNNDDSALCLLRRDGDTGTAYLGRSRPPYAAWDWTDLGVRIASPDLIRLPDDRLLVAGRLYDGRQRTSLCWLDPDAGTVEEFLTLPSGGDNAYPGLVYYDDLLWVSYYSSHEGKAAIYLAKVRLPGKKTQKEDRIALPTY